MMLSRNFEGWHDANFPKDPNRHGIYNGLNLAGADPAALLLAAHKNPGFENFRLLCWRRASIQDHGKEFDEFFPYPRLSLARARGEIANPPAWTITFSRYGVPIRVEAAKTSVTEPIVAWVKETDQPYARVTKNLVGGPRGSPRLTASGLRFAKLLTWPD